MSPKSPVSPMLEQLRKENRALRLQAQLLNEDCLRAKDIYSDLESRSKSPAQERHLESSESRVSNAQERTSSSPKSLQLQQLHRENRALRVQVELLDGDRARAENVYLRHESDRIKQELRIVSTSPVRSPLPAALSSSMVTPASSPASEQFLGNPIYISQPSPTPQYEGAPVTGVRDNTHKFTDRTPRSSSQARRRSSPLNSVVML